MVATSPPTRWRCLRALIAAEPQPTRAALSREFCQRTGWLKPDGGLKDASSSLRSRARSSALPNRAFSRVRESTSRRSVLIVSLSGFRVGAVLGARTAAVSFAACDARKSRRNRTTSMRSDVIVLRLRESTPACESSFSSRATSEW